MGLVIPFSIARFTPGDLAVWNRLADDKVRRGLWEPTLRETGRDHDRILVRFPGLDRPAFRFERDRQGQYHLCFNDRRGWHEIGVGNTADECLSVWDNFRDRSPAPKRLDQEAG